MDVGILIGRFPPDHLGGAELQAKQLAEQLANRGHEVVVFTRRYHQRPYVEELDGYTIRRRNVLNLPVVRMLWDTFPALWHIARHRPRPKVLLAYQTLNSGLIGVTAQAVFGIPTIVSIRGNREYILKHSFAKRLLVSAVFRRAQKIIVQTPLIKSDFHKNVTLVGKASLRSELESKIRVIPNGINVKNRSSSKGKKIVYVGRLIKNKGVADLLSALNGLPGLETLIVGDGPDRERLKTLAEGLAVKFAGLVSPSSVPQYLQQARMLVLPSHLGDGLPNVILEAMAYGVPVITTRTAGMPDVVQHGETGFLFEPKDIQQLTSYINRLVQDDHLRHRLSENCLEAIKPYSWECIIPQIEKLFVDVVSRRDS